MPDRQRRIAVKEAYLVVRHLRLEGVTEENTHALLADLDRLYQIDKVSFDAATATLNLAYDAIQSDLKGIEQVISSHGIVVVHDWWTHFKQGYEGVAGHHGTKHPYSR